MLFLLKHLHILRGELLLRFGVRALRLVRGPEALLGVAVLVLDGGVDRTQERSPQEELLVVQLRLERVGAERARLAGGLCGTEVQQLAAVVPVVHGLGRVDALVALQSDELAAGPAGQHLGDLGLADAGLALEQQRLAELECKEHCRSQAPVSDVVVVPKILRQRLESESQGTMSQVVRVNGADS